MRRAKARKSTPAAPLRRDWQPDAAIPRTSHRLIGLEPDNLLAFLALLGLLRALETARPGWAPRAFWDTETQPWRPVLTLVRTATEAEVAQAAAEGVVALAADHCATGEAKDLKWTAEEFAQLRDAAGASGRSVLDALAHPAARRDDKMLWPAPLVFMFGQGHQHFLSRFRDVPRSALADSPANRAPQPHLTDSLHIATTLFTVWQRADKTEGFRWDPAEDRRYALRAQNPSGDATTTQHGANCLASVALPLLPTFPIRRRGAMRLLTPTARYEPDGEIAFTWPIWVRPATLTALRALLAHPALTEDRPSARLLPQTVAIYRARRVSVGKYFNVTPASLIG